MKIQTLNKTQQKRLLSLCKEFFPEFIKGLEYDEDNPLSEDYIILNDKINNWLWIHWYQLCLTELPERIFNKTIDGLYIKIPAKYYYGAHDYTGINQALCFSKQHPVDFLWDFVKECKKNKYFKKK